MELRKNGILSPSDVIAGSKKYVWWRCEKGHEWKTQIIHRSKGTGCPVCANKIVVQKHNDFASEHPELLVEWDYNRNDKSPEEYTSGSQKSVWWICKKGHSWKTAIAYRCKGTGCPKCSEERQVSFPEKTILYYLRKIIPDIQANYRADWTSSYEMDMYLEDQKIAIEYDGIYGHSKPDGIARDVRKNKVCADNNVTLIRIREHGCPSTESSSIDYILNEENNLQPAIQFILRTIWRFSGRDERTVPIPDVNIARDSGEIYSLIEYSEKEKSLKSIAPDIAAMWHPVKNGKLTPEYVSYMSSKVVWWLGKCGHEWRSPVAYEASSGLCPYCSGKRILVGFNDLQTVNPGIASEWNYNRNNSLTPAEVTAGSGKKVWWKCEKGHEWYASIVSRNRGNGCPICANRIVLKGYNDIASFPELLADWDYEKNDLEPEEVCVGSEKKVWWRCHGCGHRWGAGISDRAHGQGCPKCAKEQRKISVAETYVRKSSSLQENRPDLVEEWDWVHNTEFAPSMVTCGSGKKAWWICKSCGHNWEASIASRSRKVGGGCPRCADVARAKKRQQRLLENKAPISITHPEIATEWNFEMNDSIHPDFVTAGSGRRVWWKCSDCGSVWDAVICERIRGRSRCPKCKKKSGDRV